MGDGEFPLTYDTCDGLNGQSYDGRDCVDESCDEGGDVSADTFRDEHVYQSGADGAVGSGVESE